MRVLQGQVALVTGGSRGIGRATAERLALEGADVILNYSGQADRQFDEEAVEAVVSAISQNGAKVLPFDADVSDPDAVSSMVAAGLATFGHIDILVNNAGVGMKHDVVTMSLEQWGTVLDVNLTAQFVVTKAILPGMIQRKSGRIVNVASELALIGDAGRTAYCAAKAGVIGFTKALAREMAPHDILVNCVAPGPTDTDMLRPESRSEEYRRSIPMQRFGQPAEVAAAIFFLVSPDSGWTTGQVFSPNGGSVI